MRHGLLRWYAALGAFVALALLVSCTSAWESPQERSAEPAPTRSSEATAPVSPQDLEAAKAVAIRYFTALGEDDRQTLIDTSPDYRHYIFEQPSWPDQAKDWAGVRIVRVEASGKYLAEEDMRRVIRDALGHPPHQVAVFHVVLDQPNVLDDSPILDDLDVVMVRATAGDDWLVSDMGV